MNLQHFLSRTAPSNDRNDFLLADQFPLTDEEIADTAINAMLLVMNNGIRQTCGLKTTRIEDYGPLVAYGVRFPWKDRIALRNYVDTVNDELPKFAAIGLTRNAKGLFAQAVGCSKVDYKSLPKPAKVALNGANHFYRATYIRGFDGLSRGMVHRGSNDIETVADGGYAGVMEERRLDDSIIDAYERTERDARHCEMEE